MRGPGILWMLQTAAGFSMAGPMFFLGLESVRTGRYEWAAFYLALGALVCYFPTYLVNRIGGPRTWIRRSIGRGRGRDGGAVESADESDTDGETAVEREGDEESTRVPLLDRLRGR